MHYYSEQDIRDIVAAVVAREGGASVPFGEKVPVEASARHVHLTAADAEKLFGPGHGLTPKRDLSQPGQYLSEEWVKLVTAKGEFSNVAVLGPLRKETQVELSLTDARALGISAPVNLSGDLTGAGDVVIVGPKGVVEARGSVIAARAHIHMTPEDARRFAVHDGQKVSLKIEGTVRPVTVHDVVIRVDKSFALAAHLDFDEANAAGGLGKDAAGRIVK